MMPIAAPSVRLGFPAEAVSLLEKLEQAGYEAWFVGGAVRDRLLGLPGHDIDITTVARPDEIQALFADQKTVDVGKAFGTIRVVQPEATYEVTTFRSEKGYLDGRHPDAVSFSDSIAEDVMRRDFTMNAMAYHPTRGLLDLYGGREDMQKGLLRAVGTARERIEEDGLRMLRAIRFAARFQLRMEETLFAAIRAERTRINRVSAERIAEELERMWCGQHPLEALDFLVKTGLWEEIFPELPAPSIFRALVEEVPAAPAFRWAALFRAIPGDPARAILKRLKLPTKRLSDVQGFLDSTLDELPTTLPAMQRFVGQVAPREEEILSFLAAEARAQKNEAGDQRIVQAFQFLDIIKDNHLPTTLKDLALSGDDLIALGIQPGKRIGQMLNDLFDLVIQGLPNTKEALRDAVSQRMNEGESV